MRNQLWAATIGCCFVLAGPVGLHAQVVDGAGLFKAETVKKANETLEEIKRQHKKEVVIETFAKPPEGKAKEAIRTDGKAHEPFFAEWAKQQAKARKLNGVYVLVCKEPSFLKVVVGDETLKRAFPDGDRTRLTQLLIANFKKKDFDKGLLDGVDLVRGAMQTNLASGKPAPTASPREVPGAAHAPQQQPMSGLMGWLIIGVAFVVGIWLMSALFKAFSGGGGGFMTGLLGGLFGGMAGMWIYNSFFNNQSSPMSGPSGSEGGMDQNYSTGDGGDWGGGGGGMDGGDF